MIQDFAIILNSLTIILLALWQMRDAKAQKEMNHVAAETFLAITQTFMHFQERIERLEHIQ